MADITIKLISDKYDRYPKELFIIHKSPINKKALILDYQYTVYWVDDEKIKFIGTTTETRHINDIAQVVWEINHE